MKINIKHADKDAENNLIYHYINDDRYIEWYDGILIRNNKKYNVDDDSRAIRIHPDLIKLLEESNDHKLEIIEIPFDTIDGWHIACNDETGNEWIAEDHRTWGLG